MDLQGFPPSGCGCSRCGGPEARASWLRARGLASRRELVAVERPEARNRAIPPDPAWDWGGTAATCERASYDPHWCRTHHDDFWEGLPDCEGAFQGSIAERFRRAGR